MTSLQTFFAQMPGFLLGERPLAQVEQALGTSPSGQDNFAFYRVLIQRNLFGFAGNMFGPLRTLLMRHNERLWPELVEGYAKAHPPAHWNPNRFSEHFPAYVAEFVVGHAELSPIFEEVADYCWTRYLSKNCPDDVGDGFDQRLFVRRYTYAVPAFVRALDKDACAPEPEPGDVVVLIFRHVTTLDSRLFQPSMPGLAALARRRGLGDVPEIFRAIPKAEVDSAEIQLVEYGVLTPSGASEQ